MLQSQETYRSSTRRHVIGYNIDELMAQWKHLVEVQDEAMAEVRQAKGEPYYEKVQKDQEKISELLNSVISDIEATPVTTMKVALARFILLRRDLDGLINFSVNEGMDDALEAIELFMRRQIVKA